MKLKYLAIVGLVSILTISGTPGRAVNQSSQPTKTTVVKTSVKQSAKSTILKSGSFMPAEHPTEGTAQIVSQGRRRYLEFSQAFQTDEGPDLYVILHRDDNLPITGLRSQDLVIIGRLQKVKGSQRYRIPNNINLANFRSVAIWCRQYNANFGYARFNSEP